MGREGRPPPPSHDDGTTHGKQGRWNQQTAVCAERRRNEQQHAAAKPTDYCKDSQHVTPLAEPCPLRWSHATPRNVTPRSVTLITP
jgi:hypothetical protein